MFQVYTVPFEIDQESFKIQVQLKEKSISYQRVAHQDEIYKTILMDKKRFLIQPVEPLNYPKEITSFLLVELEQTHSIAPRATKTVYLTFPIEIGIFLPNGDEYEIFDVFSLVPSKFTLYGDPATGVICKYWKSKIFEEMPTPTISREGILKLTISNLSENWQEVSKVVFKAFGMKLFYNNEKVIMQATMKIYDAIKAEVTFSNQPAQKGFTKAIELFSVKKLSLSRAKTYMFEGI